MQSFTAGPVNQHSSARVLTVWTPAASVGDPNGSRVIAEGRTGVDGQAMERSTARLRPDRSRCPACGRRPPGAATSALPHASRRPGEAAGSPLPVDLRQIEDLGLNRWPSRFWAPDVAWTQIVALAANLLACFRHLGRPAGQLREAPKLPPTSSSSCHPARPRAAYMLAAPARQL